jgi:hypothetical protein
MMKKSIFLLLLIAFSFFWCSSIGVNRGKVTNDLQEECQKTANEEYRYRRFSEEVGTVISTYTSHYNMNLKKCFIFLRETVRPKTKGESVLIESLVDLDENKSFGRFFRVGRGTEPLECSVETKICQSQLQWYLLVKPYLEQ